MGSISKTLNRIEKITSIFSHIKSLLIVICIIALLVVAWKAWKWMEATNSQIPNTQDVMGRVSEVRERLGEVELPSLPDTTVISDKYDEVKDKAGQIMSYRPDWLSSDSSKKEEAREGSGQQNESLSPAQPGHEQSNAEEKTKAALMNAEPVAQTQEKPLQTVQNNPEHSSESAIQSVEETEKATYSSRLGRLGESIGGVIDQVDQGVQSVQEKVDPLLDRAGELTSGWTRRESSSSNESTPEVQEQAESQKAEESNTTSP